MQTISSVRFNFTRKGELRGEVTVTLNNGETAYPRLANARSAIETAKALGAEIRGLMREVTLKSPEAIAENGGQTRARVVEYFTTPVRGEVVLLGSYAEFTPMALAGATTEDNTAVKQLVAGVATPLSVRSSASRASSASDDGADLAS